MRLSIVVATSLNNRMNLKLSYICLSLFIIACCSFDARAQLQLDRPKTERQLDNPYTIGVPREQILEAVREVFKTCAIQIDDTLSKIGEGKIVTKNVVFTRGVTTKADLEHLAKMPASEVRNWQQGRWRLEINALPLDGKRSQISVIANIEGRLGDASGGNQWVEGQSNGVLEDEVLRGLAGKILGIDLSVKASSGRPTRRIMSCEY
ncbi:MAG TPA: hypothetical protein VJ810_13410 [Blastocatellia bacterium]|nr:hypothetical protein [Blastocatellia bacterium]